MSDPVCAIQGKMLVTAFGFVTGNGMQEKPAMNRPKPPYLSALLI
jgi:hypothetical protein